MEEKTGENDTCSLMSFFDISKECDIYFYPIDPHENIYETFLWILISGVL